MASPGSMRHNRVPMTDTPAIFLDDGGVMSDNRLRGAQWRRLVGEFFPPRLGGTPDAWAAANGGVLERMLDPTSWEARLRAARGYADFDRRYQLDWLGWMCERVGVPTPPEDEALALSREATAYVTRRIRAAFPGAADAIRALRDHGHPLHTASGESSADLSGYLEAMGVRPLFRRLYGPDLVDTFKESPRYYVRVFADAGVAPGDAVVVDDRASAIGWASAAGARTVLVDPTGEARSAATPTVRSLAELPAALDSHGDTETGA